MKSLILSSLFLLTGCQLPYYLRNAYGQAEILWSREDIQDALARQDLSDEDKKRLQIVQEVRKFAQDQFDINTKKNYGTFVQLNRPFVTYVVNASEAWALKTFEWNYFIVGKMPYKGFFREDLAEKEKQTLLNKGLDVHLRGVTAYSTLGWFRDPILSSMLRGKEHDLVNLIIHESVHATLYIKNSADFNEQLATFIGNKGTEIFYRQKEGPESKTLRIIENENHDDRVFSDFISEEIKLLKEWYNTYQGPKDPSIKAQRLKEIQSRFESHAAPRMKTNNYSRFPEIELNNARLSLYKTYMSDHSKFEKLLTQVNNDLKSFIRLVMPLEDSKDPTKDLERILTQSQL